MNSGNFAAIAITLYAAHHVGDYWVQRDVDARHKGDPGTLGRLHCLSHVLSYVATQIVFLFIASSVAHTRWLPFSIGLLISGVTHYIADRRAPLTWIASLIPGKSEFVKLGVPRNGNILVHLDENPTMKRVSLDNPQLATGLWALDQSWHIFWGVFVTALVMAVGS